MQRELLSVVVGPAPGEQDGEVLLRAGISWIQPRGLPELGKSVGEARPRRLGRGSGSLLPRRGQPLLRARRVRGARDLRNGLVAAVGDAEGEARPPEPLRDLHQHRIVAGLELHGERSLVPAGGMQGGVLVDQPAIDPDPRGAAGAEVQHGRPRPRGAQHGRGIQRDVVIRRDGGAEIDVTERKELRRQRAPADLMPLARIARAGVVAVLLGPVHGAQATASFVFERPDHAPGMDRRHLFELGRGLRKLARRQRQLSPHLPGKRTHVRPCPGRASARAWGSWPWATAICPRSWSAADRKSGRARRSEATWSKIRARGPRSPTSSRSSYSRNRSGSARALCSSPRTRTERPATASSPGLAEAASGSRRSARADRQLLMRGCGLRGVRAATARRPAAFLSAPLGRSPACSWPRRHRPGVREHVQACGLPPERRLRPAAPARRRPPSLRW